VRFDDELGAYVRIVRQMYIEVPRRNGKSTLFGGIGIYLSCADNERGAEVVAAATTTKQARFIFDPGATARSEVARSAPYVKSYANRIVHEASGVVLRSRQLSR
jgi:phage terminase large subunit-like protein